MLVVASRLYGFAFSYTGLGETVVSHLTVPFVPGDRHRTYSVSVCLSFSVLKCFFKACFIRCYVLGGRAHVIRIMCVQCVFFPQLSHSVSLLSLSHSQLICFCAAALANENGKCFCKMKFKLVSYLNQNNTTPKFSCYDNKFYVIGLWFGSDN